MTDNGSIIIESNKDNNDSIYELAEVISDPETSRTPHIPYTLRENGMMIRMPSFI